MARHVTLYCVINDRLIQSAFVLEPAMSVEEQVRVYWTLNDTPDNADFPSNVTWAHVRRYINDNCFGAAEKPGATHIHVRFIFRAHF